MGQKGGTWRTYVTAVLLIIYPGVVSLVRYGHPVVTDVLPPSFIQNNLVVCTIIVDHVQLLQLLYILYFMFCTI